MPENRSPFSETLFLLRTQGNMTIFTDLQEISLEETDAAADYLESEFENERLEFLSDKIEFDRSAAIWAAKVLYYSAQLYLIRKDTAKNLDQLVSQFKGNKHVSSILSADLSLRFLPQTISALQNADPEDPLIQILENILKKFHYSAIGFDLDLEKVNWEEELKDRTYRKLYLERIVEKKAISLAEIPYINQLLIAEFGMYKDIFWRGLKVVQNKVIQATK